MIKIKRKKFKAICFVWLFLAGTVWAQTSVFLYQGRLNDNNNPANGTYEMQFKLFDALAGGNQIGATQTTAGVTVTNGVFSVSLDFGTNAFPGANRFLEVSVRRNAGEQFIVLAPRTQILTAPYSIRSNTSTTADTSTNALNLGGIAASEYVTNTNLGNTVIRNQTTQQANSNFNISGSGFFGNSVGIGTTTLNHRLNIVGSPCWTGDCWGGAIALENSAAIGWKANTSGVRFGIGRTENGLFFFRTNAELGTTTNGPIYDFKMDNTGNVGIGNLGISTPFNAKLNVLTATPGYGFEYLGGGVTLSLQTGSRIAIPPDFPAVPLGGWLGTRTNHPLYFFTNDLRPALTVATDGNIGIGTISPTAKLQIAAGNLPGISVLSQGNAIIGSTPTAGFAAIYGENTSGSGGFGLYGKSTTGQAIYADGNVGQNLANYGFAKAMLYVAENGALIRCFNSTLNGSAATTLPCGFTVTQFTTGGYGINFGFAVANRFVSVTAQRGVFSGCIGCNNAGANFEFPAGFPNNINVYTFHSNEPNNTDIARFMIIVY
jgi:hypothetical protein